MNNQQITNKLFDVYPLLNITPEKALGEYLWDKNGTKYIDLYGGHAVISIGHSHPHYVKRISEQIQKIGFYSNSVHIPIQEELAEKLTKMSGYEDYKLFLVNSGAEANENALKLASFHTGKDKIIAFKGAFHGRTSGTVAVTDNPKIVSPFNANHKVSFLDYSIENLLKEFAQNDVAAVIIEPIQGVGGVTMPSDEFLKELRRICTEHDVCLIADEIQCGYGRTGKFFAHQHANIKADLITMAKGMGNGFPIGGVLISPDFKASYGLLGTTFGGNHLACAAALAVLEVIENENLIENANKLGDWLKNELQTQIKAKEIRGQGLMIGIEYDHSMAEIKNKLFNENHIMIGTSGSNILRILPALNVKKESLEILVEALISLNNF